MPHSQSPSFLVAWLSLLILLCTLFDSFCLQIQVAGRRGEKRKGFLFDIFFFFWLERQTLSSLEFSVPAWLPRLTPTTKLEIQEGCCRQSGGNKERSENSPNFFYFIETLLPMHKTKINKIIILKKCIVELFYACYIIYFGILSFKARRYGWKKRKTRKLPTGLHVLWVLDFFLNPLAIIYFSEFSSSCFMHSVKGS